MQSQPTVMVHQIQFWAIDQLIPYERNARSHSDLQIAQIASSIGEFGFTNPILVNAKGQIIARYARYLAARKRNLEQVPVIKLEHLTEAQGRRYRLPDTHRGRVASCNEERERAE